MVESVATETEKTRVEDHFDGIFSQKRDEAYQFDWRSLRLKDKRIITTLLENGVQGKKCLDIGPGTGRWLSFLQSQEADYLAAVDISKESLTQCGPYCDKIQKVNLETDFLDFPNKFFDIVLSIEVLEHLWNPSHYFSELVRVVKNSGLILMSTPNLVSLISRLRMLVGYKPVAMASDPTHVRHYRPKDICSILQPFGLEPEFIPTSISLNPLSPKSKLVIPSNQALVSLDDTILFKIVRSS